MVMMKNKLHKKFFHEQAVLKIYHILCQLNFHLTRQFYCLIT